MSDIGEHAVVIGGSFSGMFAARVLSDGFDRVTVIERDELPDEPGARDGAPQSYHTHGFLEAGRATMEDLFRGYGERFFQEGGVLVDTSRELAHYQAGGFVAGGTSRDQLYTASRGLIEYVMREKLNEIKNIEIRDGCQFLTYLTEDGSAVEGIKMRDETGDSIDYRADIVVDATGRSSRTPQWLEDQGYTPPPVSEVTVNVRYSTATIERPSDDRLAMLAGPEPPRKRGGFLAPIEDNQWEVLLQGIHGEVPPDDQEGFKEFAASLPFTHLEERLEANDFTSSEIHSYPFPSNLRRHYESLEEFPENLIVTGDAVVSFNPVYAQGISVAALDALSLHHTLAEDGANNVALRYFDRIEDHIDNAWGMSISADLAFEETEGEKPPGMDQMNRYTAKVVQKAHNDPELASLYRRIANMEIPSSVLFEPAVVARVLEPDDGNSENKQITPDILSDVF
ncbi:NAD(P)/FAD-dependent oxidoreductase [Natronorubrum sp. FCH18a]|uniref:NAD(P)/FAD-dependent oxidoreductase n=1 Tax=Natronorubrum sp. FCH18a TaxID=3447018 RepID=UPI003F517951